MTVGPMSSPRAAGAPVGDGDVDVLVVGAGPTGLMTACQLLRCGARVRIIDRSMEPATGSRALSLWPRALDIMDDLGVGEAIRRSSNQINAFSYFSDRKPLASFGFAPQHASRILPQPEIERILTERLHALGGKVERGVRLLALDDVDFSGAIDSTDGVTALLLRGASGADGGLERVRVPFVVGADGAGSAVRAQIGAGFQGTTYEMTFALVDCHIDGELPTDQVLYYQAPTGTLVVVPAPGGVFRFLSVVPQGARQVSVPMMQAVVDERGPRGVRLTDPVWQTVFRVHARQTTDFQRGRVFLVGDAAHVHSPAGGQGMNNGLQDAHNVAWKLAAVVRGESPSSLLSGYDAERAEVTKRIVRDTDLQTRAWVAHGRARVLARDAAFRTLDRTGVVSRFYTPVMAGRRLAYTPSRETQLPGQRLGCGLRGTLPGGARVGGLLPRELATELRLTGPGADPLGWTVVVTEHPDRPGWLDEVRSAARPWPRARVVPLPQRGPGAAALGCRRPGYHLVRPDGHIAAHGHDGDLPRLAAELGLALTATSA